MTVRACIFTEVIFVMLRKLARVGSEKLEAVFARCASHVEKQRRSYLLCNCCDRARCLSIREGLKRGDTGRTIAAPSRTATQGGRQGLRQDKKCVEDRYGMTPPYLRNRLGRASGRPLVRPLVMPLSIG